jgi:hypothetical protein
MVPFTADASANAMIELLDNPSKAAEMGQRGPGRWQDQSLKGVNGE